MKRTPRTRAANPAKEISALLLSVCKVRILHYAAAKPVPSSGILARLHSHGCTIAPAALNRIFLRMSRNGWLKSKRVPACGRRHDRNYSLTPKGRALLDLARNNLKQLLLLNIKPKQK